MAPKIADLEEYVKIWAWDTFLRTRSKDYSKLRYEDVRLDINWARVKFISSPPQYFDERFAERPQSQVVFRFVWYSVHGVRVVWQCLLI